MSNPFKNAQLQIKQACEFHQFCNINELEHILYPMRIIEINIPVRMDNGVVRNFKWFRSQHNDARWPFKWWIRFHQDVTRDEVMALSMWMSIKTSVVNLPLWWGKWWIIVDPKKLSNWELERLSRWYVRSIHKYLWANFDVPAPDVNTNPMIMWWMMDEYSKLIWSNVPGSFTWKPLEIWGSKSRWIATALWGIFVLEKYFELTDDKIDWKSVVVQWAGNAWLNAAKFLSERWAKIIWISDSKWWIYNESGLDITKIEELKADRKSVTEYTWWDIHTNSSILEIECDILVLAALENQITEENVEKIKSKYILELANWPTTPTADKYLFENWIVVLPDVLANAWWVTVSYFEQVQNNINYYWTEEEVNTKLKKIMKDSTEDIYNKFKKHKINLRSWAYDIAIERILNAMRKKWQI